MQIQKVGVVGAGTMGNGIAHVFARSGYSVVLCDVEQRFLDRALGTIEKNLEREIWDGFRYGPEAARDAFGFDAAFPFGALGTEMPRLMAKIGRAHV